MLDHNILEREPRYKLLPAGVYKAVFKQEKLINTSKGGKILYLYFIVYDGQYARTPVRGALNIKNDNQKTQRIAQSALKKICNIYGIKFPPKDLSEAVGKPIIIKVIKKECGFSPVLDDFLYTNHITRYEPCPTVGIAEGKELSFDDLKEKEPLYKCWKKL